ncbi:MAG: phosphatidic acid phosphatase, partial [Saprospiraceae bacterium]|nr:phosphatidic acid phosphatase [Saprospiraceae bacterium]
MFRLFSVTFLCVSLLACKESNKNFQKESANPAIFHESVKALTNVIVHDIFSPPVASRIYAYAGIGAYEAARFGDSTYLSLAGQINHLSAIPVPENDKVYCFPMVSTLTYLKIGKVLIFSEDTLDIQIKKALEFYKDTGMPEDVFERSISFADSITAHIIRWSSLDNYKQTRSFPKYSLQKDPSTWKPTPPGYMDGIEPSWRLIRTFVMDSAQQFKPDPPTSFNMKDTTSKYYKEAKEVYLTVKNITEAQ